MTANRLLAVLFLGCLLQTGAACNDASAAGPEVVMRGTGTALNQVIRCVKTLADCGDGMQDMNNDGLDDTRVQLTFRETTLANCMGVAGTTDPAGDEFLELSGIITSARGNGQVVTTTVSEVCSDPAPAFSSVAVTWTLRDATVTDPSDATKTKTGDLVVEFHGIADNAPPSPVRARFAGTIRGTGGQLNGATGQILVVVPGSTTTGASSYYHAEIRIPGM